MDTNNKKIMIVEDDANLRQLLVSHLSPSFQVIEAGDGEEAVSKAVDHSPDVILLDLLLPKLDGFKVLERIRKYPDPKISNARVIVLSNLWSQKDILQIQGLKVDEYFVKAYTKTEDVIGKLQEILSQAPESSQAAPKA